MNTDRDNFRNAHLLQKVGSYSRRTSQNLNLALARAWRNLLALVKLARARPNEFKSLSAAYVRRYVLTLINLILIIWLLLLNWGEVSVFDKNFSSCSWSSWEAWPSYAKPHHLVLVTDPQLVDPHTYPGRPWPLSSLTEAHTDLYLRRAYHRIQQVSKPDSIFFLGDLFDGGREWATRDSTSPEEQYRKYGNDFWVKEFRRFSNIFFTDHSIPQRPLPRTVASLPGNHDLGFGAGIQLPVRQRFTAFFGESNRIDVIGNHTFVSLDTVSLSAKDQPNSQANKDIWGPTDAFLQEALQTRSHILSRHARHLMEQHDPYTPLSHEMTEDLSVPDGALTRLVLQQKQLPEFPTVLLTHVPMYRPPGTPCGPLREKYPPTAPPPGQTDAVEPDDRNALLVAGGYQYQNVLTREVSQDIVEAFNGTISAAFSGDDHDYCEVTHRGYSSPGSGIHEITVKSISWAMGVRHPGFLLVSLWNPLDGNGQRLTDDPDLPTFQTHLCLLPDQLGIFIKYAFIVAFSLCSLFVRAALTTLLPSKFGPTHVPSLENAEPLLPTSASSRKKRDLSPFADVYPQQNTPQLQKTGGNSQYLDEANSFARNRPARARPISPAPIDHGGYGVGSDSRSSAPHPQFPSNGYKGSHQWSSEDPVSKGASSSRGAAGATSMSPIEAVKRVGLEFGRSSGYALLVVMAWYFWLLRY